MNSENYKEGRNISFPKQKKRGEKKMLCEVELLTEKFKFGYEELYQLKMFHNLIINQHQHPQHGVWI